MGKSKTAKKLQKAQEEAAKKLANKKAAKAAAATVEKPVEEAKPEEEPEEKPEEKPAEQKPAPETKKPEAKKPEAKKPETKKPEAKKPEVKKPKVKEETVEDVIPEVVAEQKPAKQKPAINAGSLASIVNGERIDVNHSIDLSKMLYQHYVANPDTPENLRQAMTKQFDAMMFIQLIHWNEQTKNDFKEAGVKVNLEMFDAMSVAVRNSLGLELKGIPTKDGQMTLDFEGTMQNAPAEAKEVIETEKKVKIVTELPEYKPEMTDEEVVNALRSIMSMKNGADNNLVNVVNFARKAFKLEKEEPAVVIAKIMTTLDTPHPLLMSFRGMASGSLIKLSNPFSIHSIFTNHLSKFNYSEEQIAAIAKEFIAYNEHVNWKQKDPKTLESNLLKYSTLFKAFNDDLINQIIASAKKNNDPVVKLPRIEGLVVEPLDSKKIVEMVKTTFGADMTDKLLKKRMQDIAKLYFEPLVSVEVLATSSSKK